MGTDVNIKEINSIYFSSTDRWQRDFFAPRLFDGIVLFTQGEIEYTFSDKKLRVKKGDFLFLPGNTPYSGKKLTKEVAFYVIDFKCFSDDEFEKAIGASVCEAVEYDSFCMKFSSAVKAWERQHIDANFRLKAFVYSILSHAVKYGGKDASSSIDMVVDFISDNISDPSLSLAKLCRTFHISESQLRRNILKYTGKNPNAYIFELRMNMAKSELAHTGKSIREIAFCCGFSSPYYFSRCFSEYVGMTPTKYRTLASII